MAILDFQRPDKVFMVESTDTLGNFEFRPLEPGYGLTIGNALRRVLLSSLEGFAVTSIKIQGIEHEFSTIKGVVEDVTEMILNGKGVNAPKNIIKIPCLSKAILTVLKLSSLIHGIIVSNSSISSPIT